MNRVVRFGLENWSEISCVGLKWRMKNIKSQSATRFNPLNPNGDQHQFSPHHICAL